MLSYIACVTDLKESVIKVSSVLILLARCQQNLYDIYHCFVYSEKPLMIDRGTVRNMYSFIPEINLRN